MHIPSILKLWVADVTLRLIHITNSGMILSVGKDTPILWDSWRSQTSKADIMTRRFRSPGWYRSNITENSATVADGYGYRYYEFKDK